MIFCRFFSRTSQRVCSSLLSLRKEQYVVSVIDGYLALGMVNQPSLPYNILSTLYFVDGEGYVFF